MAAEFTTAQRLATCPLPWRDLDADTADLLHHGDTKGRYRSKSELVMSLAVRFRNHGRSRDEYIDALTDSSNAASEWYRELRDGRRGAKRKSARGREKAIKELERCWTKAGRLPAPRHIRAADDIQNRCDKAWRFACGKLTGRSRETRLRVLAAVTAIALRHHTDRPMCPERTIALDAGIDRKTARRALADLVAAGVLRRVAAETDAAVYEIQACTGSTPHLPHPLRREKSGVRKVQRLDVFRHGDLGAAGLAVYTNLHDEQQTVTALARTTGLHRNTVSRRLRDLAAAASPSRSSATSGSAGTPILPSALAPPTAATAATSSATPTSECSISFVGRRLHSHVLRLSGGRHELRDPTPRRDRTAG